MRHAPARGQAVQCVGGVGRGSVVGQIARRVIRPADDLIGGVVGFAAVGAIAHPVVGVAERVGRAAAFLRAGEPVEVVVNIVDCPSK